MTANNLSEVIEILYPANSIFVTWSYNFSFVQKSKYNVLFFSHKESYLSMNFQHKKQTFILFENTFFENVVKNYF